eukprot:gnl/Trimastix_PCT/4457.p1 GENE.gnl/Trimastix_PCT/4457~~gnl/Trimastix_PCT/4457.p1  ORF type:complete len:439 (-),score=71.69 gnl/Trimastix_PCT/4457:70-1386(-)
MNFLLFLLLCVCVSCAPEKPSFPSTYTLKGAMWRYPLAVPPINDPIDVYYTHLQQRVDHYNGLWKDYYMGSTRHSVQIARDRPLCQALYGGALSNAFPDLNDYSYVRDMVIRGIKCHQFQNKTRQGGDFIDTYNFYYDPVRKMPVRWEMYGISVFLGGHRDIYIMDYGEYLPNYVPQEIFKLPPCCDQNTEIRSSTWTVTSEMHVKSLQQSNSYLGTYKKVGVKIPRKWDWRRHGVVGPIKNQAFCGSCYAFGAVGAVESHYALKTGELHSLSESQVMDCSHRAAGMYNQGCLGGLASIALDYIARDGILTEEAYPYKPTTGYCTAGNMTSKRVHIHGYKAIEDNDIDALLEALFLKGPLSVQLDGTGFLLHQGGILKDHECNPYAKNHAVVLVGYDLDARYYIIRNSFSPISNEGGYVRLHMDTGCGLETGALLPVL